MQEVIYIYVNDVVYGQYIYSSLSMEILLYDNMYIVHSLWRYYYMIIDIYSSLSMEILLYDNIYICI
jgi:hypothetical protein